MRTVIAVRRARIVRWGVGLGLVAAALVWLRCGPIPPSLLETAARPSTIIVDRHGLVLYEALNANEARAAQIDAERLPPLLVAATIAAEDRRFFGHYGLDPRALLRAARHNLMEGAIVEGGSTITQQVAKLLIQRREGVQRRRLRTKIREAVLALRLEHRCRKDEILALYLNIAPYGNQTIGAARASEIYFGVPPAMLTAAQAAFLSGLPQRPTAFNPRRNFPAAISRQRLVLRRMAATGALTSDQLREALTERLAIDRRAGAPFLAPHFVEMVRSVAGEQSSRRLETTLDLPLQIEVQGVVDRQRELLRRHGAANVAVVVLDNQSGQWLAWEGSGNYYDALHGGTLNGPLIPRQPGSALKPFTYALAFEEGRTPATLLADVPSHFPTSEPGVLYSPRNYDGKYRGPMLARRALAGSENVPAVELASQIGVSTLLRFLSRAGLTTLDRSGAYYGLGVTLGNAEIRLDQIVAAYAAFARGGLWREPRMLKGESPAQERMLVSSRTAFWITDILSDAEARAFVFGRGGDLEFPFPVAVKTGTSQAYHDNWTIGYTPHVTVGVWVGNFDRTPLRDSSGVTGAGPIFHAVMLAAERRVGNPAAIHSIVPPPPDVEETAICALSGMRANPWCPTRTREWLPAQRRGAERGDALPCSWHHQTEDGLLTVYPPEFRAWAGDGHIQNRDTHTSELTLRVTRTSLDVPTSAENGDSPGSLPPLTIASPPPGAIYRIDPTLRRDFQAVSLRAVTSSPMQVTWLVDGRRLGTVWSDRSLAWPLEVGTHRIAARDADGRVVETKIVVR